MLNILATKDQNGLQPKEFHLKHSLGGIVDIEFMVQFTVLAHAGDYPALAAFPDNIRTLEIIAQAKLLPEQCVLQLIGAYKAYRTAVHNNGIATQENPCRPRTVRSRARCVNVCLAARFL